MTVLRGYTYGPINCGHCGTNYIMIESTDNPDEVRLSCWEGHSAIAPINHPRIQSALRTHNTDSES